jgi:hypothetical protein
VACGGARVRAAGCAQPPKRRVALGNPPERPRPIEISVPAVVNRRRPGLVVHRRSRLVADEVTEHEDPLTTPSRTLIDIAPALTVRQLEAAVNEADKTDLVDTERLREAVGGRPGLGRGKLSRVLDDGVRTHGLGTGTAFPPARASGRSGKPLTGVSRPGRLRPEIGLAAKATGCATTARRSSRQRIESGIRPMRRPD